MQSSSTSGRNKPAPKRAERERTKSSDERERTMMCDEQVNTKTSVERQRTTTSVREQVPASEVFSKLYDEISRGRRLDTLNLVFAPLGVELALALMMQGAAGRTAHEIYEFFDQRRTCHVVEEIIDVVRSGKSASKNIEQLFCNKLYSDSTFEIDERFKKLARIGYFSELESLDFQNNPHQSVEYINQWVDKKYKGIFSSLLTEDDISTTSKLVLANLMYFRGIWKYRFHPQKIKKLPFFVTPTRSKEIEMMTNTEYYGYRELKGINARMLVMPYAEDKFCLVIILPNLIDGIFDVEEKLSTINLMKEMKSVMYPEVEVFLPRFKIESTLDLTNDLENLGIVSLFDPKSSDLSPLIKTKGVCLNKVLQKTVIEVNEESSRLGEYFLLAPKRVNVSERRKFKVDHPFLFYVVNTEWPNVLYIGKYIIPNGLCGTSSNLSERQ